jgi:lipoprotein-anchoring transpeptidase ErfK/SrfK
MTLFRFARAVLLGVTASIALPAIADAIPIRYYDPSVRQFVTYDPDHRQGSWSLDPQYQAQVVAFPTTEMPGTVFVDTTNKFLYYIMADGLAIRYGVGVGKEGFGWNGTVKVGAKQEWPTWTPPAEMIERRPELVEYSSGMPGGPQNPLGARALYLFDGGRDTMFRIHGTNEPWSIGQNVSSGCIRMLNEHVIELARMVEVGAKVIVM